jgi:plastocyanin
MKREALGPIAAALLMAVSACSGGEKEARPAAPPAGAQRVDHATAGTLVGRVSFEGATPANPMVKLSGDPLCTRAHPNGLTFENYVVTDGGLDNVFVYVKDDLGKYYFDAPTGPVTLDQQGCRYVPHVVGVQVGQTLELTNSDETMHNVHAVPAANREVNIGQHVKNQKDTHTFTTAEVMVPVKCDLHPWMNAYVGVVAHPYYAVTKAGGKFELKNLPAGTYTVEAWHEKAGTQTQQVTIGQKETKDVSFTFKSAAAN